MGRLIFYFFPRTPPKLIQLLRLIEFGVCCEMVEVRHIGGRHILPLLEFPQSSLSRSNQARLERQEIRIETQSGGQEPGGSHQESGGQDQKAGTGKH